MKPLLTVAILMTVLVTACGGADGVTPAAPSAVQTPDPTFTVTGVVTGPGGAPVEGVLVRIAGRMGTTDTSGGYLLGGVPRSYGGASAMKAGYAGTREVVTVNSDTRLDFQLGPLVAIYSLSGVVSEATSSGLVPLESALVQLESCEELPPLPPFFPAVACGNPIYQSTRTDRRGQYNFSGLYAGKQNTVTVSKDGFTDPADPTASLPPGVDHGAGGHQVTIEGNTRFDVQLVRR